MAIEDIPEEMRTQEGLQNENKQMIWEERQNFTVFRGIRREDQLGVLSTGDTRENLKRRRSKDVHIQKPSGPFSLTLS